MIEHAHGKYSVEAFEISRQVFQGERQVPGGQVGQVTLDRLELAEEQPVRVDTDHTVGPGAEHPPLVIAVAATDIQYALAL